MFILKNKNIFKKFPKDTKTKRYVCLQWTHVALTNQQAQDTLQKHQSGRTAKQNPPQLPQRYSNNNFRAEAFQQLQFLQMATELTTFFP